MKLNVTLSDKPSEMIIQALADLEKIEKATDKYTVDMDLWHVTLDEGSAWSDEALDTTCHVCFAGAVLACAGVPADQSVTPVDFVNQPELRAKLNALDCLRCGEVWSALTGMGVKMPEGLESEYDVVEYEDDPAQFKKDMQGLAEELAKYGV